MINPAKPKIVDTNLKIPSKVDLPKEEKIQNPADLIDIKGEEKTETVTVKPQEEPAKTKAKSKLRKLGEKALIGLAAVTALTGGICGGQALVAQPAYAQEATRGSQTLAPNQMWVQGGAPVERLNSLWYMADNLEKSTFEVLYKGDAASPQERSAVMGNLSYLQGLIEQTNPVLPQLQLPPNLEIKLHEGDYTKMESRIKYREADQIYRQYDNTTSGIKELTHYVQKTLDKSGPMSKKTFGIWPLKESAETIVRNNFRAVKTFLNNYYTTANGVRTNGLTTVVDVYSIDTKPDAVVVVQEDGGKTNTPDAGKKDDGAKTSTPDAGKKDSTSTVKTGSPQGYTKSGTTTQGYSRK